MAHRFAVPDLGVKGHDPEALRRVLAELRRWRYDLISLEDAFRRMQNGESMKRAVVFTMDDGYFDQGLVAGPIFAEFDCPVTVFAVTGFLDGSLWLWWDQIAYIFENTNRKDLGAAEGGGGWFELAWRWQDLPEVDRLARIRDLSREAEVEIPEKCPARFAALTWDQARSLEKRGMSFGPHTLTHPVLSRTSDEQCEREMTESWRQLGMQVSRPVPVFGYPTGRAGDYGAREAATARRMGLFGAVNAQPGHVESGWLRATEENAYDVPRHPYPDDMADVLQCISGLEGLKSLLRSVNA